MRFIYCLCYAAGLGVVSFVLGRLVPKERFDYTRFPYRSFAFEKGGKIYEAISIAKWQSRVPDMSRIFPKLMPAKKIPARPDEQTLLVMIRETCAAEATHALLILAGLGLLASAAIPAAGTIPAPGPSALSCSAAATPTRPTTRSCTCRRARAAL